MCLNVQQILPALKMPEARDAADFYEFSRGPNTRRRSTPSPTRNMPSKAFVRATTRPKNTMPLVKLWRY